MAMTANLSGWKYGERSLVVYCIHIGTYAATAKRDWDRTSSPDLIGYMMVCVRDLHGCISTNGGIIRFCHPKGKRQDVGALSVRGVQVESPVSFLDYLRGGCEINLMVAIDVCVHPCERDCCA